MGLDEMIPVDTSKGEPPLPAFRAITPNGKVPAIIDTDEPGGREPRVFDSALILPHIRNCSPGSSSSPPVWGRSQGRRCISGLPHSKGWPTPRIVTGARPNATTRC